MDKAAKWPKTFPPLTEAQRAISDDFMRHWHEVLPQRFGMIEEFNHGYVVKRAPRKFRRTLEIGAGLGEHLQFENLSPEQRANYVALELRQSLAEKLRERWPQVRAVVGDCQTRVDFPAGYFDRIIAVHVLEHLPNLPATVAEMYRLCDKESGVFQIVIPCEGSFVYGLARRISAQRIFEKRYNQPYRWFIEREHINRPHEIREELSRFFRVSHQRYFPLGLPTEWCNLCIGLTLIPRSVETIDA